VIVRTAFDLLPSPARVHPPTRPPLRIGLVQMAWNPDPQEHERALADGIRAAAHEGARIVFLPELTRLSYMAVVPRDAQHPQAEPEALPGGPTFAFAARCAQETGAYVHASCYEAATDGGIGYNTAFVVAPDGALVARTRKTHLPVTAGYYEDTWFRPGDSGWPVDSIENMLGPVVPRDGARLRARRSRGARLPDRDRLGAGPSRLRHRAHLGTGH